MTMRASTSIVLLFLVASLVGFISSVESTRTTRRGRDFDQPHLSFSGFKTDPLLLKQSSINDVKCDASIVQKSPVKFPTQSRMKDLFKSKLTKETRKYRKEHQNFAIYNYETIKSFRFQKDSTGLSIVPEGESYFKVYACFDKLFECEPRKVDMTAVRDAVENNWARLERVRFYPVSLHQGKGVTRNTAEVQLDFVYGSKWENLATIAVLIGEKASRNSRFETQMNAVDVWRIFEIGRKPGEKYNGLEGQMKIGEYGIVSLDQTAQENFKTTDARTKSRIQSRGMNLPYTGLFTRGFLRGERGFAFVYNGTRVTDCKPSTVYVVGGPQSRRGAISNMMRLAEGTTQTVMTNELKTPVYIGFIHSGFRVAGPPSSSEKKKKRKKRGENSENSEESSEEQLAQNAKKIAPLVLKDPPPKLITIEGELTFAQLDPSDINTLEVSLLTDERDVYKFKRTGHVDVGKLYSHIGQRARMKVAVSVKDEAASDQEGDTLVTVMQFALIDPFKGFGGEADDDDVEWNSLHEGKAPNASLSLSSLTYNPDFSWCGCKEQPMKPIDATNADITCPSDTYLVGVRSSSEKWSDVVALRCCGVCDADGKAFGVADGAKCEKVDMTSTLLKADVDVKSMCL